MRPSVLRKFSAALSHNSASKRFRLNRPILAAIFFSVALVPLFYKPDLFPFGGDQVSLLEIAREAKQSHSIPQRRILSSLRIAQPPSYRVLAYGYDFRGQERFLPEALRRPALRFRPGSALLLAEQVLWAVGSRIARNYGRHESRLGLLLSHHHACTLFICRVRVVSAVSRRVLFRKKTALPSTPMGFRGCGVSGALWSASASGGQFSG